MKRLLTKNELGLLLGIQQRSKHNYPFIIHTAKREAAYLMKRGFIELKNNEAWIENLGAQYILLFSQQQFEECQKLEKPNEED